MDFAFLVHSRDYRDVERKFKIAKFLPKKLIEFWCMYSPPILVSKIEILKAKDGGCIKGYIIGIPMTAQQILENRERAIAKIESAIKKAKKLGAQIVGLGALTSSITNSGLLISEKSSVYLTTGNSLTAAVALFHSSKIIEKNEAIKKIAIMGSTGSIGQAITKILIEKFPEKNYLLYARRKDNLENLIYEIREKQNNTIITGYANSLENLDQADFIIVATSATEAIINSRHLKHNVIVYDVTQPQNIDRNTLRGREDVTIYDGGLIFVNNLSDKLPFGLPPKVIFSCLAETILLALNDYKKNFSLGPVKPEQIKLIQNLAKINNFEFFEKIR